MFRLGRCVNVWWGEQALGRAGRRVGDGKAVGRSADRCVSGCVDEQVGVWTNIQKCR